MVARRIRSIRRRKGLTQEELAKKIGVSRETISRYEKGHFNPSIEALQKLAKALSVPISEFFSSGKGDK